MVKSETRCERQRCSISGLLGMAGVVVLLIAGMTSFPVNVYAHEGNSDPNMIHACVQRSSNQVRIVGLNGACTRAEVAVHWPGVSSEGPMGPEGPEGVAGPAGPAGPQGDPAMLGFEIVTSLPDVRLTGANAQDAWYLLEKRNVSLNKVSDTSKLRITYQDTLGAKSYTHNACRWRIVLDGTVLAEFSDADVDGSWGWRMHNGAHVAWAFDVPAGPHEVRVDGLRSPVGTECLSGWNTSGNFLSVEEIP